MGKIAGTNRVSLTIGNILHSSFKGVSSVKFIEKDNSVVIMVFAQLCLMGQLQHRSSSNRVSFYLPIICFLFQSIHKAENN